MTPDPEYTVVPTLVYRVVGPDGKELELEDDHGTYPWDFATHDEALACALEEMALPFHGPLTEEEMIRAERNRKLYEPMIKMFERSMVEMLNRPSLFMPSNSSKTIQFYR